MPRSVNGGILNSKLPIAGMKNGGTLGGTGMVGTTQVNAGDTLQPGTGTAGSGLTVNGSLIIQAGSTYFVQTAVQTAPFDLLERVRIVRIKSDPFVV